MIGKQFYVPSWALYSALKISVKYNTIFDRKKVSICCYLSIYCTILSPVDSIDSQKFVDIIDWFGYNL